MIFKIKWVLFVVKHTKENQNFQGFQNYFFLHFSVLKYYYHYDLSYVSKENLTLSKCQDFHHKKIVMLLKSASYRKFKSSFEHRRKASPAGV